MNLLLLIHQFEELGAGEGIETAVFALLVDGGAHEIGDAHAGDFNWVLKAEEDAFAGTLVDGHVEDVFPLVYYFAFGDSVFAVAGDDTGEGALAVAVGTHDRVYFAPFNLEVDAFQNFFVADGGVQIAYGK